MAHCALGAIAAICAPALASSPLPDPNLVRAIAQGDRDFAHRFGLGRDPRRRGGPAA